MLLDFFFFIYAMSKAIPGIFVTDSHEMKLCCVCVSCHDQACDCHFSLNEQQIKQGCETAVFKNNGEAEFKQTNKKNMYTRNSCKVCQ